MFVLQAKVVIKPEARDRWFQTLDALLPPSRAEAACVSYAVYESTEAPNTFLFVEEWTSLEGFAAHNNTPHVSAFFAVLDDLLVEPPSGTMTEVSSTLTLDEALAASGITPLGP